MASFADPRSCLREFLQTGRNIGKRPPSLSLRNLQRDIRSVKTRIENIGDRIEGAIGAAARGEFLPGQVLSITNEFRCPPTHYASYFGQHQPAKHKYMFFVALELNPAFTTAFGTPWANGEMWWFIKQSGRPNVTYEYEDVNMYNFRQKVVRRATLNPVRVSMYDDIQDASASFWNTFIRIQSPITNLNPQMTQRLMEESGMNWNDPSLYKQDLAQVRSAEGAPINQQVLNNGASTGILPGSEAGGRNEYTQIIKELSVYHLIDWGRKYVRYQYINPRINTIEFDELTWESSEPNTIEVEFEYDTFHMHFPLGVSEDLFQGARIPDAYPINPNLDETPVAALNKGLDAFNTGVQSAVDAAKAAASSIPGFGNIREF